METFQVNWDALDALVIDFAKSDDLIEEIASNSSSSSSSRRSRLIIRSIRSSIEEGNVDFAVDLLRRYAPAVLDDRRLLFRLQKQKFVELLRKGTAVDRRDAVECLQKALAPCALDAYPEAYEEFKHAILALIYNKEDENSPVSNEWSEKRRGETAGILCSIVRGHLQAYDPVFSMTLRYLISIHKIHCFRQGIRSPISEDIHRLILEDRDPPGILEESSYDMSSFDEVDIQALAHAVDLTRQDAVDSLRFARGNLYTALQNELCRIKLNETMLDELVHEYCIYRGLVYEDQTSGDSAKTSFYGKDWHIALKDTTSITAEHETVINITRDGIEEEMTCSTSHINESASDFSRRRKARNHGFLQQRTLRKWKGRGEVLNEAFETLIEPDQNDKAVTKEVSVLQSLVEVPAEKENKYGIMLELKELTTKGMAAEVVDEIDGMDPDFFRLHPVLLFQLKQVEFLKCVSGSDHDAALRIALSYLGPLTSKNPELLKPLKETLFALLNPGEEAMHKCGLFSSLAASLQVALGKRFQIEEPLLMNIIRTTLHSHKDWFRLQMCSDRFEGFLKIDYLKNIDSSSSHIKSESADNSTAGSILLSSSGTKMPTHAESPVSVSSDNSLCGENAILKVMEFLALPRAEAIHLLMQFNGNAETVIQQMFQ